jgi:hypothetical protein
MPWRQVAVTKERFQSQRAHGPSARAIRWHPGRPLTDDGAQCDLEGGLQRPFRLGDGRYCFPLTVQDG